MRNEIDNEILKVFLGINVGTSYISCSTRHQYISNKGKINESFELIPTPQGERLTPSFFSAGGSNSEYLIGKVPKQLYFNNIPQSSKIKKPVKQLYQKIISEMIINPEKHFNRKINVAQICFSIPSSYSNEDVNTILGIRDNIVVVNEAISSFLYYSKEIPMINNSNNLVIDIGGNNMKLSYLNVQVDEFGNSMFNILHNNHFDNFGGEILDNIIIDYCIKVFSSKNNIKIPFDKLTFNSLKLTCEMAKMRLSYENNTMIEMDNFYYGKNLEVYLSRENFEILSNEMFIKIMSFLDDFLSQNHITLDKIDNVILVGGCMKIPKIYSLILSFFHGKNILKSLNPDEANAI